MSGPVDCLRSDAVKAFFVGPPLHVQIKEGEFGAALETCENAAEIKETHFGTSVFDLFAKVDLANQLARAVFAVAVEKAPDLIDGKTFIQFLNLPEGFSVLTEKRLEVLENDHGALYRCFQAAIKKESTEATTLLISALKGRGFTQIDRFFFSDHFGEPLLVTAAKCGKEAIFKKMLAETDLKRSSSNGDTLLHKLLGVDAHYMHLLFDERAGSTFPILDHQNEKGETALFQAGQDRKFTHLKLLLSQGADYTIRAQGKAPSDQKGLIAKAHCGDYVLTEQAKAAMPTKLRVRREAELKTAIPSLKQSYLPGISTQAGVTKIIREGLLDPNAVYGEEERTMTHLAAVYDLPVFEALEQQGADFVEKVDANGRNALCLAAWNSSSKALSFLSKKFSPAEFAAHPDKSGNTPYQYLMLTAMGQGVAVKKAYSTGFSRGYDSGYKAGVKEMKDKAQYSSYDNGFD